MTHRNSVTQLFNVSKLFTCDCFFFFSSRRRHTRCSRDWSSDVCSSDLDGTANCTGTVVAGNCTLTPTSAGAKSLVATYAGDANFAGSTSAGASHTVNAAGTTTTITAHTPDPSAVGQAVSFTFTVVPNAPGSGTPTGNVTEEDTTQL